MKKLFTFLLLVLLLTTGSASANNFFDFFRGNPQPKQAPIEAPSPSAGKAGKNNAFSEEKSQCGKQIEIFKIFLHDGKICKKDDDCVSMNGVCPLGCKLYINKNFISIIEEEMRKVTDICPGNTCAYKCPNINIRPICKENKCQARTN